MSVILSLKQMFLHRGQKSWQRPHKLGQSRSYKWEKQVIAGHVTVGQHTLFSLFCAFFFSLSDWKKTHKLKWLQRKRTLLFILCEESSSLLCPCWKQIYCNTATFSKLNFSWAQLFKYFTIFCALQTIYWIFVIFLKIFGTTVTLYFKPPI